MELEGAGRRLAAIMFTDLVGYNALPGTGRGLFDPEQAARETENLRRAGLP